jgi:hypothetical protein
MTRPSDILGTAIIAGMCIAGEIYDRKNDERRRWAGLVVVVGVGGWIWGRI